MSRSSRKTGSFRDFFSLIFVFFSLYLTGDVFYRWEGFSYYAPFSEFLPSVALASILWSVVSVLFTVSVWLVFKLLVRLFELTGLRINADHFLLGSCLFVIFGILFWKGKKSVWPDVQTAFAVKLAVLLLTSVLSIYLTWLFRNRAARWIEVILDRITPMVWIFGLLVLVSVPFVTFHALSEGEQRATAERIKQPSGVADGGPNIILLTFDALAARNMSVYGYQKQTTPFITRWSENATVFTAAEAASNFTTPAVASLMTGKRVWTHQTYHINGTRPVRSAVESLPALLKEQDYFNIGLVVNPFASVRTMGMSGSFDVAPPPTEFGHSDSLFGWKFGIVDRMLYRAFGEKIRMHNWILKNDFIFGKFLNLVSRDISRTTVPPDRVFNRFLDMLDHKLAGPFFAWIHVFPPHDPYLPPGQFKGKYNSSSEYRTYKEQEKLIEKSYKYLFQHRSFPDGMKPSVDLMRDYYDEFVRYVDSKVENFIHELDKRNTGDTLILLSADHGESFEHGYFTHGGPFLYEQVTHIPLIIREPGQEKGRVVSDTVEQIDIPATILDYAGIARPSWMEGRSLVPLMRGQSLPPRPVFSMNFEKNRSRGQRITKGSVAVWEGEYKMIHYLEKNESELFNIKEDPDERFDLAREKPGEADRLRMLIMDGIEKANRNIPGDIKAQN